MNDELLISVGGQLHDVVRALVIGIFMGIYYDFWRTLRAFFKSSLSVVAIEDLIFWISSAVAVFFATIQLNSGFVRIYFVALILAGWFVYYFTIGSVLMFIVNKLSSIAKNAASFVDRRFFKPVNRFAVNVIMSIYQKIQRHFVHITKNRKNVKKC